MAKTTRSLPQSLRHYLVNPLALGYLGIVLGVCLWVATDAFFASSSGDASFAGVWASPRPPRRRCWSPSRAP